MTAGGVTGGERRQAAGGGAALRRMPPICICMRVAATSSVCCTGAAASLEAMPALAAYPSRPSCTCALTLLLNLLQSECAAGAGGKLGRRECRLPCWPATLEGRRPFSSTGAAQQLICTCIVASDPRATAPCRPGEERTAHFAGSAPAAASAQGVAMSALDEPVVPAALPSDDGAGPSAAAAAAATAGPSANGAAEQPQQRVRLIRVKRKRGTDAPEDLGELGERDVELPAVLLTNAAP